MMCCIYAQRLVFYKIFVWRSQLIMWPLLHPLHFIINVRNKCITSSLGEWQSAYNDDHKFLVHQLPPLFVFSSFRWDENKFVWHFVFHVLRIYDDLMSEWLGTTCTARMYSTCEHVLAFPLGFWPLVLHFSLLFRFFCIFPYSVFCSRVCLSSEFPFSVLRFLVSPLRFFFFSDSSMVDYSAVIVDCPSIAFFFCSFR